MIVLKASSSMHFIILLTFKECLAGRCGMFVVLISSRGQTLHLQMPLGFILRDWPGPSPDRSSAWWCVIRNAPGQAPVAFGGLYSRVVSGKNWESRDMRVGLWDPLSFFPFPVICCYVSGGKGRISCHFTFFFFFWVWGDC